MFTFSFWEIKGNIENFCVEFIARICDPQILNFRVLLIDHFRKILILLSREI